MRTKTHRDVARFCGAILLTLLINSVTQAEDAPDLDTPIPGTEAALGAPRSRIAGLTVRHHPVPGGIAVVAVAHIEAPPPEVFLGSQPVAVVAGDTRWYALAGLALNTPEGAAELTVRDGKETRRVRFDIGPAEYAEQRITLSGEKKKYVEPPQYDMERIGRERAHLKAVKQMRSGELLIDGFHWPASGIISSTFGMRRFFNDQPRNPHGGYDIAAPTGSPVYAPADGTVIDAGDYFFNGQSIFLEHGLGIQSFFAHLDDILVETGQPVKRGDLIGRIGETGRVTGAHLHWSVGLNGTWVDPILMLADGVSLRPPR